MLAPSFLIGAGKLARALGGRKAGSAWMARCSAHDDRKPSLGVAPVSWTVMDLGERGVADPDGP